MIIERKMYKVHLFKEAKQSNFTSLSDQFVLLFLFFFYPSASTQLSSVTTKQILEENQGVGPGELGSSVPHSAKQTANKSNLGCQDQCHTSADMITVTKLTHRFSSAGKRLVGCSQPVLKKLLSICLLPQTQTKTKSWAFVSKPMFIQVNVRWVLDMRCMCSDNLIQKQHQRHLSHSPVQPNTPNNRQALVHPFTHGSRWVKGGYSWWSIMMWSQNMSAHRLIFTFGAIFSKAFGPTKV